MVKGEKCHVEPLRIGEERVCPDACIFREESQQVEDAEADQKAHERCDEDHDDDLRPEIVPCDGLRTERRDARTDDAADERMGRGGGDCVQPGHEVPDDRGEDSGSDERERDALCLRVGVEALRYELFDRIGHAGTDREDRKRGKHLDDRSQRQRRIRLHGAAGNQRCDDVASVVKAVYICEDESKNNKNPKREMHDIGHSDHANVCEKS